MLNSNSQGIQKFILDRLVTIHDVSTAMIKSSIVANENSPTS